MKNILFDFIERYMPLTDEEKGLIASLDVFRSFQKGDILLREGEISNQGYFVLQGCIRTFYEKEGDEKTTEFFTEMEGHTPNCAITKQPSEYYISCVEDSIVSVSNPDMEADVFAKFPRFETLCRILSEELLAGSQRSFDDFKTSSPEQRYLNLLKNRPALLNRVPQHQLASYLGMKPQSLSRIRSRIIDKIGN